MTTTADQPTPREAEITYVLAETLRCREALASGSYLRRNMPKMNARARMALECRLGDFEARIAAIHGHAEHRGVTA